MKYLEISNKEYHARPELGSSGLKKILENPRKFKSEEKKEPTDEMNIGSLFHALVLERDIVDQEFAKIPSCDRRTKEGKEIYTRFEIENSDKITLKSESYELAESLAQKALAKKLEIGSFSETLEDIVSQALCEKSFFATLEDVACKCRPDILINLGSDAEPYWLVIDLKSCEEATENAFVKTGNYGYHIQEEFYRQVLADNGIHVSRFLFMLVGKAEYSNAEFFEWSDSARFLAGLKVHEGLELYKYCMSFNYWPESKFNFEKQEFAKITKCNVPNYLNYR